MHKIRLLTCYTIIALLAFASQAQTADPDYLDGSLYLKQADTSTIVLDPYAGNVLALNTIFNLFGVDSIYDPFVTQDPLIDKIFRVRFTDTLNVNSLIAQLELLDFIDWAEKVPLTQTTRVEYLPNDLAPQQWYLTKINAVGAWDFSKGDTNITIAVVDNGIRLDHEDILPNLWFNPGEIPNNFLDDDLNGFIDDINGYDMANFDNNPNPPPGTQDNDPFGHGTHCAGIASAATDNGKGMAGIGFSVKVIAVKCALDETDGSVLVNAYQGVDYAISAGADIVSMSFGSRGVSTTEALIIQTAASRGIVLIAAAGNSNESTPFYPAGYPEVIAVAATNTLDEKASFSNYGTWVDVSAPGTGIYSCLPGSNSSYGNKSGTSMACPLVAGLAGLVKSFDPSLTRAEVKDALVNGCENIDLLNPTYVGQLGAGRINAMNTMLSLTTTIDEPGQPVERLQIYPNPASDRVWVRLPDRFHTGCTVRLVDLFGRTVHSGEFSHPGALLNFEFPEVASGIYSMHISGAGAALSGRLNIR